MSMIKVLVKRPGEKSEVREIENDWKIFKALIGGGMLECVSIGAGIMMYLDEEGKLKGLPYNFRLGIFDIAVGDVVFFGNDGGEEEQELRVVFGRAAGVEQILSAVRAQRPVVVLAAAVDALKGFFVQQTDHAVPCCGLLHYFHR